MFYTPVGLIYGISKFIHIFYMLFVGQSVRTFVSVAHFLIFDGCLESTQCAAIASGRATNLATHPIYLLFTF